MMLARSLSKFVVMCLIVFDVFVGDTYRGPPIPIPGPDPAGAPRCGTTDGHQATSRDDHTAARPTTPAGSTETRQEQQPRGQRPKNQRRMRPAPAAASAASDGRQQQRRTRPTDARRTAGRARRPTAAGTGDRRPAAAAAAATK